MQSVLTPRVHYFYELLQTFIFAPLVYDASTKRTTHEQRYVPVTRAMTEQGHEFVKAGLNIGVRPETYDAELAVKVGWAELDWAARFLRNLRNRLVPLRHTEIYVHLQHLQQLRGGQASMQRCSSPQRLSLLCWAANRWRKFATQWWPPSSSSPQRCRSLLAAYYPLTPLQSC